MKTETLVVIRAHRSRFFAVEMSLREGGVAPSALLGWHALHEAFPGVSFASEVERDTDGVVDVAFGLRDEMELLSDCLDAVPLPAKKVTLARAIWCAACIVGRCKLHRRNNGGWNQ